MKLINDISRTFLEDGDTVTLRGQGELAGKLVNLGDVSGKIIPSF